MSEKYNQLSQQELGCLLMLSRMWFSINELSGFMSETTHNLLMVRGEHQQEISYDEPNPVITDDLQ